MEWSPLYARAPRLRECAVLAGQVVILLLSKVHLSRPNCLRELQWAIEQHCAKGVPQYLPPSFPTRPTPPPFQMACVRGDTDSYGGDADKKDGDADNNGKNADNNGGRGRHAHLRSVRRPGVHVQGHAGVERRRGARGGGRQGRRGAGGRRDSAGRQEVACAVQHLLEHPLPTHPLTCKQLPPPPPPHTTSGSFSPAPNLLRLSLSPQLPPCSLTCRARSVLGSEVGLLCARRLQRVAGGGRGGGSAQADGSCRENDPQCRPPAPGAAVFVLVSLRLSLSLSLAFSVSVSVCVSLFLHMFRPRCMHAAKLQGKSPPLARSPLSAAHGEQVQKRMAH
eukprot:3333276-Rhodomonas_salina.1